MWDAGVEGSDFRIRGTIYRGGVPANRLTWQQSPQAYHDFVAERFAVIEGWVRLRPTNDQPAAWINTLQSGIVDALDPDCN